jgi:hypothetical protein
VRHSAHLGGLLALAAITVACAPAPSPTPQMTGSITYQFSGDSTVAGELPFIHESRGEVSTFDNDGWAAYFGSEGQDYPYLTVNSHGTGGFWYDDGQIIALAESCTSAWSQNDASGLAGTIDCSSGDASLDMGTGLQVHPTFHATVDIHS